MTTPPAMTGRTVLITGATSGIGQHTARTVAAAGADLILVCRDPARAAKTRDELTRLGPGTVDIVTADLSSQQQIRDAATTIIGRHDRLDVLVNNAGGVFNERKLTVDGVEQTFAVNHLAPFLLTHLLLDLVRAAPQGRVVTVASEAHAGKLDFANLQGEKNHQFLKAYAASKTANILFTYELARRLRETTVTANAVSPGPSRTAFGDNLTGAAALFPKVMKRMPFFHSAERGARAVAYAAAEPTLAGVTGQFFMNSRPRKSKPITHDLDVAGRLWRISETLTGISASSSIRT